MKVVSLAGLVAVVLIVISLLLSLAGRIVLDELRAIKYIIALLLLDAAQDASHRGDEALSALASTASVIVAALTLS